MNRLHLISEDYPFKTLLTASCLNRYFYYEISEIFEFLIASFYIKMMIIFPKKI